MTIAELVTEALESTQNIALIGTNPRVVKFLTAAGYRIVPIDACPDMILVLREEPDVESILHSMGWHVPVVWFQKGVTPAEISCPGVQVVSDRCVRSEYRARWPSIRQAYLDLGGWN